LTGTRDGRLEMGKKLGADAVVNVGREDPVEAVQRLTQVKGVQYVLECSGAPNALNEAARMVNRGGRICLAAFPAEPVPVDLAYLVRNNIYVFGIRGEGDCQEFRARLSGLTDQSMAAVKRSPKRTANCDLAMDHSRGGMIHSFSDRFKTRKRSLVAASSVGKWPLALTARRSLAFSASMAFVVYKIRRTSPGKA